MGISALVTLGIWRGKLKSWNEWGLTFHTLLSWNTPTISISKYKTWKPPSSFINKHKSSTRKEQNGDRWNREEGEDIKFGLGFSLIYDMYFIKTIIIYCYIISPKGCQLASQVYVNIFDPTTNTMP